MNLKERIKELQDDLDLGHDMICTSALKEALEIIKELQEELAGTDKMYRGALSFSTAKEEENEKLRGKLDNFLLKELGYDLARLRYILDQVPIVYCEITNGRMSYAHHSAANVIAEYEQCLTDSQAEISAEEGKQRVKLKVVKKLLNKIVNQYCDCNCARKEIAQEALKQLTND